MSHNPFRKARVEEIELPTSDAVVAAGLFDSQAPEQTITKPKTSKKKKVVIKTPPRSPEEPQRRPSLGHPPSPKPQFTLPFGDDEEERSRFSEAVDQSSRQYLSGDDIFSSVRSQPIPQAPALYGEQQHIETRGGVSNLEPGITPISVASRAPANPFARTLATTEEQYGVQQDTKTANTRSKASFDVDTFKNILLNGAAPPMTSTLVPPVPGSAAESNTETPETVFQQRFPSFEASVAYENKISGGLDEETSSEDEDTSDDDRLEQHDPPLDQTTFKPETVGFDVVGTNTSGRFSTLEPLSNGPEKALPALPLEAAAAKAMPPPPPPASRRHAQSSTLNGRRRSSSVMSKSSTHSDASSIIPIASPGADGSVKAPPPPPTRRSLPAIPIKSSAASEVGVVSPSTERVGSAPPAPAPRRAPKLEARSPSGTSRSSLQAVSESGSEIIPPRPPPRRAGDSSRSSVDGAAPTRKFSSQESDMVQVSAQSQNDLLSDLAALQREVDALRAKAGAG